METKDGFFSMWGSWNKRVFVFWDGIDDGIDVKMDDERQRRADGWMDGSKNNDGCPMDALSF